MPIDTHAHYVPPHFIDEMERAGAEVGISIVKAPPSCQPAVHFQHGLKVRPFFPKLIEPLAARLAAMDKVGMERQVLSTWADIFGYGLPRELSVRWHRRMNQAMAKICAERPERFSFLASLPLPHAAESAQELGYAVHELGAVGAVVCANVEGVNLGEVPLDDLWSAVCEMDAGVLIHPAHPDQTGSPAGKRTGRWALATIAEYTHDTTLCVGSLIFNGVLDRHPRLRFLLCHGGGNFPYLASRFDIMHAKTDRKALGNVAAMPPSTYLPRFYYDTILHSAPTLEFLERLVGMERIVLGTDYSFPPADEDPLATLRATRFSPRDIELITEENPRRLFPQLPGR